MKKSIRTSVFITLLSLCLLLAGCSGSRESAPGSALPTLPAQPTGFVESDSSENLSDVPISETEAQEEPYPFEAYAYSLGTEVPVDFSDEKWALPLADGESVYGIVYRFTREDFSFTPLCVRKYSSFPVISGDQTQVNEAPLFHGKYKLWVNIENLDYAAPRFHEITDPSVFGALEDLVMGLDYAPISEERDPLLREALFTVSGQGIQTDYSIGRDGSVLRNDCEAAVSPLSEEATAYFFAIVNAWATTGGEQFSFFTGIEIESYKALRVRTEDTELFLTGKDANALAGLLSEQEYYAFACTPRFNCGLGSHGEALYEITLGNYDPESGLTSEDRCFTLWSDGHLTVPYGGGASFGLLDHDQICDQLVAPCWYISENTFDLDAVAAFLENRT